MQSRRLKEPSKAATLALQVRPTVRRRLLAHEEIGVQIVFNAVAMLRCFGRPATAHGSENRKRERNSRIDLSSTCLFL